MVSKFMVVISGELIDYRQYNTDHKIQSKLPAGAVPLCIVFYADKSKLSSFGTAKGYPVIV